MGFQSQEQRRFLGLFTTKRKGAAAPRFSAEDVRNIDFQYDSLKGRAPTERVISTSVPQYALFFDGKSRYLESDYTDDDFSLNDLSSGATVFDVRAYISGLNLNKLSQYADDTRWFICGSTGNSTDFGLASGQVEGWAIMLRKTTSAGDATIHLEVHFRQTDGVTPSDANIQIADFQQYWTDEQDSFLIEFLWDRAGTQNRRLALYKNGSTSTSAVVNQSISTNQENIHLVNTGAFRLTIGAFRDNNGQHDMFFDGTIGQVEIWSGIAMEAASSLWLSWNEDDFDTDVTGTLELLVQPDAGEGVEIPALGSSGWTSSGAGKFQHFPLPVRIVSNQLILEKGAYAQATLSGINSDGSKVWMVIVEFNLPEQAIDFSAPPYIVADENERILLTVGSSGGGDYEVSALVTLFDASGDPSGFNTVSTTSNLSFDTTYKIAFVIEPKYENRLTDVELFIKIAGTWSSVGVDIGSLGAPAALHNYFFATNDNQARLLDVKIGAFRIFNNMAAVPALAADVEALDTYPGDTVTTIGFPERLAASFDLSESALITTETTVDAFERVTEVLDNLTGNYNMTTFPDGGLSAWATIAHVSRGRKPSIFGIFPSIVLQGTSIENYYSFLLSGGVYRYNQDTSVGKWLQHRSFGGCPCAGVRGIDVKSRLILFGAGFCPSKVFPRGTTEIGLRAPTVAISADSGSINDAGGLVESNAYSFRATLYNSQTGQESNVGAGTFTFSTSAGHDALSLKFTDVHTRGTDDWDTIRIYRKEQNTGLYRLDSEIPRPDLLPPAGPDLTFEIRLPEADLLVQQEDEIDNDPPPDFKAAALADNVLHIGGGGLTPGWVQYSKAELIESFPPSNIWRLDNNHGNEVMAIATMFARLVIIKQTGVWGAREDAARTGVKPTRLHQGRGLASRAGWTIADNVLFWISTDKSIYVTDGIEIEDVSSPFIKQTMQDLTVAQLSEVQASHDGRSKQVWFLIPHTSSGSHRMILVYDYVDRRWTRYEIAADSIQSGHDQVDGAGDFSIIGFGGHAYRVDDTTQTAARDSDGDGATGVTASFDYDNDDSPSPLLTDSDGDIIGVNQLLGGTFSSWVGMPIVVVVHTTAFDNTDDDYLPLYDEPEAQIFYTYIAGVRDGVKDFVYFGHRIPRGGHRYVWVGFGVQKRYYESQWIAPQGEDRPYHFNGTTFVQQDGVTDANDKTLFRNFVDHSTVIVRKTFTANSRTTGRDKTFKIGKRGRRFKFKLLGTTDTRDEELHYGRVMWRYQVKGPVRRRGA